MTYVTRRARTEQRKKKIKSFLMVVSVLLVLCVALFLFSKIRQGITLSDNNELFASIPEYDGNTPYIEVNGNKPYFTDDEKRNLESFEEYSELDA